MASDLKPIREAVRTKAITDATLKTLLGVVGSAPVPMYNLRVRKGKEVPCLLYYDTGDRPDNNVPLVQRLFTFEAYHEKVEGASAVLTRVVTLFDRKPLTIAGGGWKFQGMYVREDDVDVVEDGDIVKVAQSYLMLLYDLG